MADNSRKRPRKSKLEPRQDIEEDSYTAVIPIKTQDLQVNIDNNVTNNVNNIITISYSKNKKNGKSRPVIRVRKSLMKRKISTSTIIRKDTTESTPNSKNSEAVIRVRKSLQNSNNFDININSIKKEDETPLPNNSDTISKLRRSLDKSKIMDNDVSLMKFSVEIDVEECNDIGEGNKTLNESELEAKSRLEFEKVIKPVNFSSFKSKTLKDFNKTVQYVADEPESIIIKQEPLDDMELLQDIKKEMDFDENIDIKEEIDPADFLEQYDDDIVKLDYSCMNELHCKKEEEDIKVENEEELEEFNLFMKCTACKASFPTLRQYIAHLSWHGIGKYTCPDCRQKFSNYEETKLHLESHFNNDFINLMRVNGMLYQCKKCAESITIDFVFAHWEAHIDWTKKEGVVPRVDTKNPHKMDAKLLTEVLARLQNPNKRQASKECIVCERFFDRRPDCKRHLIEHLLSDSISPDRDELVCQICGELCKNAMSYRKHMRRHACWREISCDQCDKTFSDSSNLAKHRKLHISDAFVCDTCGKKFIAKRTLVQHVLNHMDSPPLHCHSCDRTFYTTGAYKKHLRAHHDSTSKKYVCNRCGERFLTLKEKWDHGWENHAIRRDKTANCPICNQAFRKKSDVKRHVKSNHSLDYLKLKKLHIRKVVDRQDTIVIYE